MTDRDNDVNRRSFIKTMAAIPVAAAVAFSGRTMAELVSESDPTANALGYVAQSQKDGQTCANCALYQGGDAPEGGCPLFPGKEVAAAGWCKSWAPKP